VFGCTVATFGAGIVLVNVSQALRPDVGDFEGQTAHRARHKNGWPPDELGVDVGMFIVGAIKGGLEEFIDLASIGIDPDRIKIVVDLKRFRDPQQIAGAAVGAFCFAIKQLIMKLASFLVVNTVARACACRLGLDESASLRLKGRRAGRGLSGRKTGSDGQGACNSLSVGL
jgi:hypothetical protein